MKLVSRWGITGDPMMIGQRSEWFSIAGHVIAVACALYGLYLIVADSLDSAVYGVVLFGLAIALDVVVASRCDDRTPRRPQAPPPRIVSIRTKPSRTRRGA